MTATAAASRRTPPGALRHVLTHLITPLLMCVGMGLGYLGAFGDPAPHHMPVAVVSASASPQRTARAQVMAQTMQDKAGSALDVRTVPTRADAVHLLKDRRISGAYVMSGSAPELLVASAGSDTDATVVRGIFTPVADRQGTPLKVTDVVPPAPHDPTGQGLFFVLVAVSIGSYASVAVIGGAGAPLRTRIRALLAVGMSAVVSAIGAAFAGPVFHVVDHGLWGVWGLAWLYSAGILLVGTGLHTFLKRWTTLGVMVLFVMLNFTSSGGVLRPEMQNGFFGALHSFWDGAGFVEGARDLVYFGDHGLAANVTTLACWLLAGLAAVAAAGAAERGRRSAEDRAARDATAIAAAALGAAGLTPARDRDGDGDRDDRDVDRRRDRGRGRHASPDSEEEMRETVAV